MVGNDAPVLAGPAADAVSHRGSNLSIVATAGSGKTEVVSQRVASLIESGARPRSIVAFTFTRKAAAELKERIAQRTVARLGEEILGSLSTCYVGTIHAYALQRLREVDARYEDFDLVDDMQLSAFLTKERRTIGYDALDPKFYAAIAALKDNLNVVEAEMLDPNEIDNDFGEMLRKFYDTLDRHRLLTHGRSIALCVQALRRPEIAERYRGDIEHLIVDEYQDVDPAQEHLIRELHDLGAELCVVGDDDQSIYQWRGASVGNIVSFAERYDEVAAFDLVENRRSRPGIVQHATHLATTITGRIDKDVTAVREASGGPEIVAWRADTEEDEAQEIAATIERLHDGGHTYSSMAILVRSRTPLKKLAPILRSRDIPVSLIGSGSVFETPIGEAAGKVFVWLGGIDWRIDGPPIHLTLDDVIDALNEALAVPSERSARNYLSAWYDNREWGIANFVRQLYELLEICGVRSLSLNSPRDVEFLANLGQFTQLLTDFEHVYRRARIDANGEYHGARPSGERMYQWLAIHMMNLAQSEYAALTGEPIEELDAVTISTIHAAKGLEWPIVFVPSLTKNRFAYKNRNQDRWHIPSDLVDLERYAGSGADERRIFYVAMTRAREWLSLSAHRTPNVQKVALSPFMETVNEGGLDLVENPEWLPLPGPPDRDHAVAEIPETMSLSALLGYSECGTAYWYKAVLNFQPPLARELGYGKAVHHVLRLIAEDVVETGNIPGRDQINSLVNAEFYIPFGNSEMRNQMAANATAFIQRYINDHGEELRNVWAVERPFELRSTSVSIAGRADVVVKVNDDSRIDELAIVDYKTAHVGERSELQVRAYVGAGRAEGLDVVSGFVHNLKSTERQEVATTSSEVDATVQQLFGIVESIGRREFVPNPGERCMRCDVMLVCPHSTFDPSDRGPKKTKKWWQARRKRRS